MAKDIRGINNGGGNNAYKIPRRGIVPRNILVKEVNAGNHPNHHVMTVKGKDYVRSNPNSTKKDNVNRN